jgi:hypothetical protein
MSVTIAASTTASSRLNSVDASSWVDGVGNADPLGGADAMRR